MYTSWSQKYFCVRFGVYYKGKPAHTRKSSYFDLKLLPENAYFYIDNRDIRGFFLYKDGLRLLEVGKEILANNFIVNLNNFFLDTHTHHPPISL